MKIGYPCLNRSLGCTSSRTFRLASYSPERIAETVALNLSCLRKVLDWNESRGLLFFRISSDLVPFASHPVCRFDWAGRFRAELEEIGEFIRTRGMRISMHPDQFTLINSPRKEIWESSRAELTYHAEVLDAMRLDKTAKIQIHVGGVYGDRERSLKRFAARSKRLPAAVRRRLVIENDDRSYGFSDCLKLQAATGIPVLFDVFHDRLLPSGMSLPEALAALSATWKSEDGLPMIDYSCQEPGKRPGSHGESMGLGEFKKFLKSSRPFDFDLMLEIKDKEISALAALRAAAGDTRLKTGRN